MKIAILTLPLHSNYGGIIQNYALQTVLERMGHEVYTIDIRNPQRKLPIYKMPFSYVKRLIKKISRQKGGIIFLEQKINREQVLIEKNVRRFINNNISLTKRYNSKKELYDINNNQYDVIIMGSDQIWRVPFAKPNIETYFADFITNKKIKKIAFSASFGTDEIEFSNRQIKSCKELISTFILITVREKSGLHLINDIFKWHTLQPPQQTIDPTLLLRKEDYMQLFADKNYTNENKGGLFYYILDMTEEKKNIINNISRILNIKPFTVNYKSNHWSQPLEDRIVPPIEKWLKAFNDASFVFTDSFHGSVFSIIFNKNFISIGNKTRGMGRFTSLFDLYQLSNRLIYNDFEHIEYLVYESIDWTQVNNITERETDRALSLLTNAILN